MISSFDSVTRRRAGLSPELLKKRLDTRKANYEGVKIRKIYWQIGEVAEMLNVEPSALRFYENEGISLTVGKRNKLAQRRYKKNEICYLAVVVGLARWFKLDKIRLLLFQGRGESFLEMLEPGFLEKILQRVA